MSFPPDVFLIGAMKAGTTSLAEILSQHPDICVASPKEPHFLTEHVGKSLDWYRAHFDHPDRKICIDASTSYSIAPIKNASEFKRVCTKYRGVPERISAINPSAKFIYVLREPVARTYSHYNHNARAGWERRPFIQAIREDAQYLSASHYLEQLEFYWKIFPRESILLLSFEEFMRNPVDSAYRCFDFLGLNTTVSLELDRPKNVGFLYNPVGIFLHKLGLLDAVSGLMPATLKQFLAPLVSKTVPPISQVDRDELARYFMPLNAALSDATGFNVSAWSH